MAALPLHTYLAAMALLGFALLSSLAAAAEENFAHQRAQSIRSAVEQIRKSVCQLQPFGGAVELATASVTAPTSGVVLDADGLIVTSSFGFEPPPASIVVTYDDGTRATGKLLATDHNRRLALVRASRGPTDSATPLTMALSPRVGETVVAVGRTFRADEPNLAVGIVSALNRLHGRAVQTDAAVSPANYGGPLIDLSGRVVGILTHLAPSEGGPGAGAGWYDSGIGFAARFSLDEPRLQRLRSGEDLYRGLAGVAFVKGIAYDTPPKLLTVHPGGPADRAGLKAGDVIHSVNDVTVASVYQYRATTDALDAGQTVVLRAKRDQQDLRVEVPLSKELLPYRHPYLGLVLKRGLDGDDVAAEDTLPKRVLVAAVMADSPADQASIMPGDALLSIDGDPLSTRADMIRVLAARSPGERVSVLCQRDGTERTVELTLGSLRYALAASDGNNTESVPVKEEERGVDGRTVKLFVPQLEGESLPALVLPAVADPRMCQQVASGGVLVASFDLPEGQPSLEAEQAFLTELLNAISSRPDVDENRIAVGGEKRAAPYALALGQALRSRFAGVVLQRWSGRPPRLTSNKPDDRLGVLILDNKARSDSLRQVIDGKGYPVQVAPLEDECPAVLSSWLQALDQL